MMRTASPGRGTAGARRSPRAGPSSSPTARTSSLNRLRSGSTSSKSMSSGSPPTLWCDLMLALSPPPDSTMSGYSVPCTRKRASPKSRAASSNTRMNSSPMILRLRSGSTTSSSASRKRSAAFTCTRSMRELAAERLLHLLGLAVAQQPGVDEDARRAGRRSPCARARRRPRSRRRRTARRSPARRRPGRGSRRPPAR